MGLPETEGSKQPSLKSEQAGVDRLNSRQSVRRLFPIGLLAMASLLSGCTAIGFGLGHRVDHANEDRARTALANIARGTIITLHMRDGSRAHGWFLALIEPDTASYASFYREWVQSTDSAALMPIPGERVRLNGHSFEIEGAFRGLSPAGVRLKPDGSGSSHVVSFEKFEALTDASNQPYSSYSLLQLLQTRSVPTGTLVEFHRETKTGSLAEYDLDGIRETVAWDDVMRADISKPAYWTAVLTTVGVFIDVWLLHFHGVF